MVISREVRARLGLGLATPPGRFWATAHHHRHQKPTSNPSAPPPTHPQVLYFYVETRCELRCWRTGHRDGDGATRATRAARADEVQPVPSVGGSGGGGGGGGGGRKRQRSAVSEAEARTRAAAAVDRWAAGRAGLPALLVALSEFRGVFGPEARQKLLQAAPAAEGATGPAAARQVTRAYHVACLQLHPDRHATSPPEMRALAEELFKVLSAAFVDFRALPGSPGLSC